MSRPSFKVIATWIVLGSWQRQPASTLPEIDTESWPESPQGRFGGRPDRGVYKARITPNWFAENTRFWYRNDLPATPKSSSWSMRKRGPRAGVRPREARRRLVDRDGKERVPASRPHGSRSTGSSSSTTGQRALLGRRRSGLAT